MARFNPYLNFNGNTEEAFNFYKSVFGGEFTMLMRFRDVPGNENMPADVLDKIMHIALPIGNGNMLMATDSLESLGQKLVVGNNHYFMLGVDSKEEADNLFAKLSVNGTIEMELQDTFWGDYYGSFSDQFGIQWMIDYEYPKA
jgi:PhnB protein